MADFTLRLPAEIDELVKGEAQANRRSKQQHLVYILEERYRLSKTEPDIAKKPTKSPSRAQAA